MDAAKFWKVIDSSRSQADGDPEKQIEVLREKLAGLLESEILEFDRLFTEYWVRAYTWDLWGAAYLIGGGCSDDGFMDFRGWLISKGEKVYREALADPESLVQSVTDADDYCQIEGFQYVATDAWTDRTGQDRSEYPHPTIAIPTEPSGQPWTEEQLSARFPNLTAKFG